MNTNKVWYITGASKGLGLSLAKKLLALGYKVAATSRSAATLNAAIGKFDTDYFLPLEVNLTDAASIQKSVELTEKTFGRIDVVVNNAGYGIGGNVEELSEREIHDSFNVNVFATINVIKSVLPGMRARHSGHIINISSIAGFAPASGWGIYAATKYAVIGLSEVLADEVKPLGINVTVVAPGAFRTQFLSSDSLVFSEKQIDAYKAVRESHNKYKSMDGSQAGDPEKAADVFIELAENAEPPVRLFMGTDAYNRALAKIDTITSGIEKWKETSFKTDF